jgi:hypothetical protein
VDGLGAGTYRLVVETRDRAPRVLDAVSVEADAETQVGTIRLDRRVHLALDIEPALDPDSEPWRALLQPLRPLADEQPTELILDPDGSGTAADLRPTEYALLVRSSRGDVLLTRTIRIDTDERLLLTVPLIQIEGKVELGGEPLAAHVLVETGAGDRVGLDSDDDGMLTGWIRPPERPWLLVTVRWRDGDEDHERSLELVPSAERDGALILDIDLPARVIYGQVVDHEGRARPGMRVTATPAAASARFGSVEGESGPDGRFHITGLEPMLYRVQAGGNGRATSEQVLVDLGGDLPAGDVRLVVWPTRRLQGRLLRDSLGVPGANVVLHTVGRSPATLEVRTAPDGSFVAELPAEADRAVVTVVAPSATLWSACMTLGEDTLSVTLPSSPPGTLRVTTRGRRDLPPATAGRSVLVTGSGGFITQGTFSHWNRLLDGARDLDRDGNRIVEDLVLPSIAADRYALTWSLEADGDLAARSCAGALGDVVWQNLPPAGEATLSLDLAPVQARRLADPERGH